MKGKLILLVDTILQNDLFMRAFNTFWQTGLIAWAMTDFSLDLAVIAGAGGAGLSAAKTILRDAIKNLRG